MPRILVLSSRATPQAASANWRHHCLEMLLAQALGSDPMLESLQDRRCVPLPSHHAIAIPGAGLMAKLHAPVVLLACCEYDSLLSCPTYTIRVDWHHSKLVLIMSATVPIDLLLGFVDVIISLTMLHLLHCFRDCCLSLFS